MDLSYWVMTPGLYDSNEFVIPKGTVIKAGGSIILKGFDFKIKSSTTVVLFESILFNGNPVLSGEYILFDLSTTVMAI